MVTKRVIIIEITEAARLLLGLGFKVNDTCLDVTNGKASDSCWESEILLDSIEDEGRREGLLNKSLEAEYLDELSLLVLHHLLSDDDRDCGLPIYWRCSW